MDKSTTEEGVEDKNEAIYIAYIPPKFLFQTLNFGFSHIINIFLLRQSKSVVILNLTDLFFKSLKSMLIAIPILKT